MQDVFLALYNQPEQFEARSSVATYLYAAATHACLNRMRDGKNRTRLVAIETAARGAVARGAGETPTRSRARSSPALSDDDAALAVYLYCDELTHDEIAELARLLAAPRRRPREPAAPTHHGASGMICDCTSRSSRVDRLLAGELAPRDAAAMRDHAAACARCGGALDDALRDQHAFADPPRAAAAAARRVAARDRRRRGGARGAAAVLALVLAWPRRGGEPQAPQQQLDGRAKGTSIVGFFVAHGTAVRRGAVRETGDARRSHRAVHDDDASRRGSRRSVERRHACTHRRRRDRRRRASSVLPGAIELDDALGDEVVTGVFCADAVRRARVRRRAARPIGSRS